MEAKEPYGIGLKFSPPSLFIFYESEIGKRRRKIPLRKIHAVLKTKQEKPFDLESYLSFLISNYAQHLRKISRIQLQKNLQKVLSHHEIHFLSSNTISNGNQASSEGERLAGKSLPDLPPKSIDLERNLNIATDEELDLAKRAMDLDFKKNRISKDSENFQYDIKKDFGKPTVQNEWDSSDEDSSAPPSVILKKENVILKKHLAKENSLATIESSIINKPTLVPIKNQISKKEKKSLADDLDFLLDSLENPEKEKSKKTSKKVTIISDKEDGNEKRPSLSYTSQKSVAKTDSKMPDTKKETKSKEANLEQKPNIEKVSNPEEKRDESNKKPESKSILRPLSSLSGLPPLNGPKSLPPAEILGAFKNGNSLALETTAPSNSFSNSHNPKSTENPVSVIQAVKAPIKSAVHDILEDDISEEILAASEDEDEEFALLQKKLHQVSQAQQKEVQIKAASLNDNVKDDKASIPGPSKKEEVNISSTIKSSALDVTAQSVSIDKSKSFSSSSKPKDPYDYEDDFEAGHTDDEIVFSDDGLSIGSVEKDDHF